MNKRIALFVMLTLPVAVNAQSNDVGRFEMTPYGAYSFGGTFSDTESDLEAKLQDSASFGLLLNLREGSNTQWELLYSLQDSDANINDPVGGNVSLDMAVHYLQLGGTYQGEGETVRPYLAATLGATHFEAKTDGFDSDTFFSFSVGPGVQIRPNERLGLRLEARIFGTFVRSSSDLFCLSDPAGGLASCAITVSGDMFYQVQTMAGVVFRF